MIPIRAAFTVARDSDFTAEQPSAGFQFSQAALVILRLGAGRRNGQQRAITPHPAGSHEAIVAARIDRGGVAASSLCDPEARMPAMPPVPAATAPTPESRKKRRRLGIIQHYSPILIFPL